jgi:hypothetical protein
MYINEMTSRERKYVKGIHPRYRYLNAGQKKKKKMTACQISSSLSYDYHHMVGSCFFFFFFFFFFFSCCFFSIYLFLMCFACPGYHLHTHTHIPIFALRCRPIHSQQLHELSHQQPTHTRKE